MDLAPELPDGSYAAETVASAPASMWIAERGRALVWADPDGEEVDIDGETLRGLLAARREAAE